MIDQNKIYQYLGTHYEMGFQQGKDFQKDIAQALQIFKNLEEIQSIKPKFLPTNLFMKIAANKTYKWLKPIFEKYSPNQDERIKGIADGSGINVKHLYFLCGTELLLNDLDWELPHFKTGCTSIAYKSNKTESGHALISRNFDYAKFVVPYLVLRRNLPTGFNRTYDLTAMVLPGTFNGMNERGVFIATDEAFPTAEINDGLSASIIMQDALETCNNTEEVITFFKKAHRGSGNVILVADPSDNIKILEYTSQRLHVREPYEGDDFIVGTNHYISEDLKKIDIPREAVFGKNSPKNLRGVCINETSYVRKEIAEKKIRSVSKVNVDWLKKLHRDHSASPDGNGGMETICHHDPANISAASMIINLSTFESLFCFGLPCENEYKKFNFKK
ncbi:MAG: C45 family autoproteolytic acyltransferase/hydrolase [Promethearchaeota archaeon]